MNIDRFSYAMLSLVMALFAFCAKPVAFEELTDFFQAFKNKEAVKVSNLIRRNEDLGDFIRTLGVSAKDFEELSESPLFLALGRMKQLELHKLLTNLANLKVLSYQPLLHAAAQAGNLQIVKLLLLEHSNRIALGAPDIYGKTVLDYALESKNAPLIRYVSKELSGKQSPRDSTGQKKSVLLFQAIRRDDKGLVANLIKKKTALVNAEEPGTSALNLAISLGKFDIAKLLIQNGADVNFVDSKLQTPLFLAVAKNQSELVKTLLEHGADDRLTPGQIPLLNDAVKSGKDAVFTLLLEYTHTDVNKKDRFGNTILSYAIKRKNLSLVKLILTKISILKNWDDYNELLEDLSHESDPKADAIVKLVRKEHHEMVVAARSMVGRIIHG